MNDKDKQTESIAQLKKKAKAIEVVLQRKEEERSRAFEEDPDLLKVKDGKSKGKQLLKRLTPKSMEEILDSGTPEEVGYLFFAVYSAPCVGKDDETFYLWTRDRFALAGRLGEEGMRQANRVFASIYAMRAMETDYDNLFKNFQRNAAFLARLIALWEGIKQRAETLNSLYKNRQLEQRAYQNYKTCISIAESIQVKWGEIKYNKEKHTFYAEVEPAIKQAIRNRRDYVNNNMREIKALVKALEDYLQEHNLKLSAIPYTMALYTLDIKIEQFIKCLHLEDIYLKSKLNERIANGEAPTQEEITRAVFPDYYEIEADQYYVSFYSHTLKSASIAYENLEYFDMV